MAEFQLGIQIDPKTGEAGQDRLTVESGELTTHGAILGMTGSGKTGLGIVLLEEALLSGTPALILDPKGDMGNLLLTFPELSPQDFRPWVDEDDASGAGMSADDFAAKVAADWKEGLAAQGMGPDRIKALRDAADFAVYTPGSEAGIPVNIVGSLQAPPLSWDTEAETLRDEIEGTVTSLLGLVGIEADLLSSREFVLLSNLVENAWRAGQSLDLGSLIGQVQTPPLRKLGVFELDAFFPQKDRTELAMKLNALVASPSFAAWGEGQPLDPATLLHTPEGKPRAAVVYLAHLSDEERQFVVTLVLSKVVTWMRGQPGTSDLRVLVYMDEVFGFVPPTAAPPAKKPILTIFKQARAFGVGMVLATQNPVDADYKVMSNAATWMVGRLQTERDKARVLEGLQSAAGGTDVATLDKEISGLGKRQFLFVSAKSDEPRLFQTRWAMSYLRGPLTKDQVSELMQAAPRSEAGAAVPAEAPAAATPAAAAAPAAQATAAAAPAAQATEAPAPAPVPTADSSPIAPVVASGVQVAYLDPAARWGSQVGATSGGSRLVPFLAARVNVRFDDTKADIDEQQVYEAVYGPLDDALDLSSEQAVDYDERDFAEAAPPGATYVLPSIPIGEASFFREAERDVKRRLVDTMTLELQRNRALKLVSRPGETPEEFAQRCDQAAEEAEDAEAAKITARLEAKRDKIENALELAQRKVEELDTAERSSQSNELVAGAGEVLGALFGGRRSARSIATAIGQAASKRGTSDSAAERRETAVARAEQKQDDLAEIEQEIIDEVQRIDAEWQAKAAEVEAVSIRAEAADVRVEELKLLWVPSA